MSTSLKKRSSWFAWAAIAVVCVVYGPMAVEYTWRLFDPDAPQLWNRAFAAAVGPDQALGAGSIHLEEQQRYADNRTTMLLHTTLGGVVIVLFATQFSARFRRNLRRHRILGRVAAGLALTSMVFAAAYLLAVGPEDTFDGPAFHVQLWALAGSTAVATVLGVWAAVKRQIAMHQSLMALAFAMLLTAPLLRVLYIVLGLAWPDATQLETNLAGGAVLATWAPLGAILASRALAGADRRGPGLRGLPGPALEVAVVALVLVTLPVLLAQHADTFDGTSRTTATGVTALAVGWAVIVGNRVAALRAGRAVAAEEWRIHSLAATLAVPALLGFWWALDWPFTRVEAFYGSLLVAQATTLILGLLLVIWRRRRPARSAPATPAPAVDTIAV